MLRVVATRRLPAPVQLPALVLVGRTVLALGGLDAADASVANVTRVEPAPARAAGTLPQAVHDAGAAALGGRVYVLGGGTAGGAVDAIVQVGRGVVAHLPAPASDLESVRVGNTILVVAGSPVCSRCDRCCRTPRGGASSVSSTSRTRSATQPRRQRPTGRSSWRAEPTGVHARDEIVRVDPARRRATVIGRLPSALSHVAGAVLRRTLYLFGGRSDSGATRRTIWAVDTRSGLVKAAGRLPVRLSDAAAITTGDRILVAGGRTTAGRVSDRVWELALRR